MLKYFVRRLFMIYIFKISKENLVSMGTILTWGSKVKLREVPKIWLISETGRAINLKLDFGMFRFRIDIWRAFLIFSINTIS